MFSVALVKRHIPFLNLVSVLGVREESQVPEEQKEL